MKITSCFGERYIDGKKEIHDGIDVVGNPGETKIYSMTDGTIKKIYKDDFSARGKYVIINYQGWDIYYQHLDDISLALKEGSTISATSYIGEIGATGNSEGLHLHIEVRKPGTENHESALDVTDLFNTPEYSSYCKRCGGLNGLNSDYSPKAGC